MPDRHAPALHLRDLTFAADGTSPRRTSTDDRFRHRLLEPARATPQPELA